MQEVKSPWCHLHNITNHFQVSKESPETVMQEGRTSQDGRKGRASQDGRKGRASQDGPFHTPTAGLLHGTVCYRCEAKIPNTIQNQATRR